jgi:alkylation response protein AidB-like acyl-CoA dehydrogenase
MMSRQSAVDVMDPPAEAKVDWVDRVRKLGPMIDACAAADETATELKTEVVDALDEAGVFAASAPRVVGGGEIHPVELIDLLAELSYWDPSAGWYAHAVMSSGAVAGSCLGPRAVEAIFPNGKYLRAAGGSNPGGKAVRVGDGYRISGKFMFGTGTRHAGFRLGGYVLHEGDEPVIGANGQPVRLVGYAPTEHTRLLGNWNVLGLRGTGSYDFEVMEHVLHEDFFFTYPTPVPKRGGQFFGMGFLAHPSLNIGAFALGAARRMLDEWKGYARGRTRLNGQKVVEMQTFHRDLAIATADLKAADAYMKQTYTRLFDAVPTDSATEEMKLDGRLSASHAHRVALRVANTAFVGCSTYAMRNGNALQRVFRDICAGSTHSLTHENSMIDLGSVIARGEGAKAPF